MFPWENIINSCWSELVGSLPLSICARELNSLLGSSKEPDESMMSHQAREKAAGRPDYL